MATKKEPMIFLYDKNILPWPTKDDKTTDPERFSVNSLKYYRASTTPKEYLGSAIFKTLAGPYLVTASAAIYSVDLARILGGEDKFAGGKYKTKEETMFVGGIQVIDDRVQWVLNGKIWYAKKMPKTGAAKSGLPLIILNNEITPERKTVMIDMIIKGYEFQAKEEEERRRFEERLFRR